MTITTTSNTPLVAVVGATGLQGGSVINALAASSKAYRVRGFTRDPSKPAAQALKAKGVQVVQVELGVGNRERVFEAFVGADYVFLVTNFWEHVDMEREISEGKLLIDASKAAGVRGIIWSGLPSVKTLSNNKYTKVYHFDGKAQVTSYGLAAGVPFANVPAGFYAQNFLAADGPLRLVNRAPGGEEGEGFVITLNIRPETTLPVIDIVKDYGLFVRRVIEAEVFPHGAELNTASEVISARDIARTISEVTGKKVSSVQISTEDFLKTALAGGLPAFIAEDIIEGFSAMDEFGYYGGQPLASTEGLGQAVQTFRSFAESADWSKVLA
ncbi:NAD(P)-binding protein [Mycena amicta]|nr:NAD(P)-binding protein [Mycena amicta]